jgi:hypothetical protein
LYIFNIYCEDGAFDTPSHSREKPVSFVMSVRLSPFISAAPTGRISVEFHSLHSLQYGAVNVNLFCMYGGSVRAWRGWGDETLIGVSDNFIFLFVGKNELFTKLRFVHFTHI